MNPCSVLSLNTFGSSGLSTSVLGYFNKVVAMAFLILSLINFEDSAMVCALVIDAWYWFYSPVTANAALLTLMFWKVENEWSVRDKALCLACNCKVDLHTSNLPPRYIPLTVFSNLADNETKKAITTTILKYPEADFRIGKPELQKYIKATLCKDSSIINHGYLLINQ